MRYEDESVQDKLDAEIEAKKSETEVLREALQLLSRISLRFQFESSTQIEELKARVAALEGKMK